MGIEIFSVYLPLRFQTGIIGIKEIYMPQTMTLDEKLAISMEACALWQAGDKDGFHRVIKTAPMPPYLAEVAKKTMGASFLVQGGFNLSEAEAEFGPDWLSR